METKIYKYPVTIGSEFVLEMPKGAKILTVQMQEKWIKGVFVAHDPYIWAIVHLNDPQIMEQRKFRIIGTGHLIEDDEKTLDYIGTFQTREGYFVWHLFEKLK